MINQIGEIISCYAIDKNGTRIEFGKISNIEVECSFDGSKEASITISPTEKGELFKITAPEKGEAMKRKVDFPNLDTIEFVSTTYDDEMTILEKGEKELNGTIVYCRFETADGEFNELTKKYAYYVAASPEDCVIKEGTIFKVWNADKKETECNDIRLRCDALVGVINKADANLLENQQLKSIENIMIDNIIVSTNKKNIRKDTLSRIDAARLYNQLNNPLKATDVIGFVESETISEIDENENKINTINLGGNDMNTNMFGNMFKNMKFGKLETNDIKYSMKGIAFKTTDGDYVCYNPDFTFTNVANMVMDIPIFAMPVSKDQIKVGDVIKHNNAWVIVNDVTPSEIKVAKPWTKEIVSVIPETSIFGFSFYTKIMNPFENFGTTATADNPFGNILPLMLMSGGDAKNSNDTFMMMLALGGGKIDFSNPMMMYMLMGDKGNTNDMLMMMMLSGNNPFEQKHECKCGCNVGDYVATPNVSIDPCFGADFDWTKFVPGDEIKINANAMDVETDK